MLVAAPYLRGVLTNGFVWLDHGEIVEGHLIITQLSQLPALFTNDLNFAGYHRPGLSCSGRDRRQDHH